MTRTKFGDILYTELTDTKVSSRCNGCFRKDEVIL
nr:MAG TPA: hypothetical protein [Caudoviricetes sp.]